MSQLVLARAFGKKKVCYNNRRVHTCGPGNVLTGAVVQQEKVGLQIGIAIPAPDRLTVATRDLSTSTLALDEIAAVGTLFDVVLAQHGPIEWNGQ